MSSVGHYLWFCGLQKLITYSMFCNAKITDIVHNGEPRDTSLLYSLLFTFSLLYSLLYCLLSVHFIIFFIVYFQSLYRLQLFTLWGISRIPGIVCIIYMISTIVKNIEYAVFTAHLCFELFLENHRYWPKDDRKYNNRVFELFLYISVNRDQKMAR